MAETISTILTAESGQFHREFNKAKSTISDYQKSVMKVAGVLGGSAVFAAVAGKFNALRNSIDQLNDQAARLEMPVEELQRLNAVAAMSGSSVETLSKALTKAKLQAIAASQGSKELGKDFAALGINAKEFLNLDATEQILAISKGFNSASDKGAAFAAVFSVLGKGAKELIPMLRDGEAGIEAISRRLQVLGGEDVAAVARLNDEIDLLSANLDTKMKGAFLALRPQIEGFINLLSQAADGMAIVLDPAGGVGMQGGTLGGEQMLKELDKLDARIAEIKITWKGGSWLEGPLGLTRELRETEAAAETLRKRFSQLDTESQIFATQLAEIDRLRKSGLGDDGLRTAIQQMAEANASRFQAIDAEKNLATVASDTADEIERQAKSSADLVKNLETLQQKVGGRILALQSPEKRQEVARSGLSEILKKENAASADELRKKVGAATNDGDRGRMLQSLDAAMDRLEEIKRASGEIEAQNANRFNTWQASIKAGADAAKAAQGEGDKLVAGASESTLQANARSAFAAEREALKLEVAGHKELALSIREEIEFRKEAVDLSKQLGISEDQALRDIRERAQFEKRLNQLRETDSPDGAASSPGRRRSRIRVLPNGAFDMNSGNNLNQWKWRMDRDAPRIESRFGAGRNIEGGLRNSELRRRAGERAASSSPKAEYSSTLEEIRNATTAMVDVFRGLGAV